MCCLKSPLCSTDEGLQRHTAPLSRFWCLMNCLVSFFGTHTASFLPYLLVSLTRWIDWVNETLQSQAGTDTWTPPASISGLLVMITTLPKMWCGTPYPHLTKPTYFLIHGLVLQFRCQSLCLAVLLKLEHYFSCQRGRNLMIHQGWLKLLVLEWYL